MTRDGSAGRLRTVHARAPIRVNDLGGWTDTWFGGRGRVLNVAVEPAVEVQVRVSENRAGIRRRVTVRAANYGQTFQMDPEKPAREPHGLLQFSVASFSVPRETALDVGISSFVPAGISTGTSASVTVALLGALNRVLGEKISSVGLARMAHLVETEKLGQQSGIQDQIAAARGGITFIEMRRYPDARVSSVRLPADIRRELDRRLILAYLGRPHRSSSMHEKVIAGLAAGGRKLSVLEELAGFAEDGRAALSGGDLQGYGRAMIRNHEGQRRLHPGLISAEADAVGAVARRCGALGWKVNGAGGRGGSMTVLAGADDIRRWRLLAEIESLGKGVRVIPTRISSGGVSTWEDESPPAACR